MARCCGLRLAHPGKHGVHVVQNLTTLWPTRCAGRTCRPRRRRRLCLTGWDRRVTSEDSRAWLLRRSASLAHTPRRTCTSVRTLTAPTHCLLQHSTVAYSPALGVNLAGHLRIAWKVRVPHSSPSPARTCRPTCTTGRHVSLHTSFGKLSAQDLRRKESHCCPTAGFRWLPSLALWASQCAAAALLLHVQLCSRACLMETLLCCRRAHYDAALCDNRQPHLQPCQSQGSNSALQCSSSSSPGQP